MRQAACEWKYMTQCVCTQLFIATLQNGHETHRKRIWLPFCSLTINYSMNVFLLANGSIVSYFNFQYCLTLIFMLYLLNYIWHHFPPIKCILPWLTPWFTEPQKDTTPISFTAPVFQLYVVQASTFLPHSIWLAC